MGEFKNGEENSLESKIAKLESLPFFHNNLPYNIEFQNLTLDDISIQKAVEFNMPLLSCKINELFKNDVFQNTPLNTNSLEIMKSLSPIQLKGLFLKIAHFSMKNTKDGLTYLLDYFRETCIYLL